MIVNTGWRAGVNDVAISHHCHSIAQREGLGLVMGYEDGGDFKLLDESSDLFPDMPAQSRIKVGEGFVQ